MTVKPDGQRGDNQLANFLVDAGADPADACAPEDAERADCTVNPIANANAPVIALTGSSVAWSVVLTALLLLIGGVGTLALTRRARKA